MTASDAAKSSNLMCLCCNRTYSGVLETCTACGALLVLATGDDVVGSKLSGLYEIESILGHGGTSIIYRARHQLMDRVVAIKMLLWSGDALHDEKKIRRFQQEARMSSRLNHAHIATLYDFGVSPQGQPYLVMEYLEGTSLEALGKADGPMDVTRAVKIFLQICDAIEHAHQKGVIHRDLKPSNVLVTRNEIGEDVVKVVDFGLAEMLPNAAQDAAAMKITGPAFGSPLYMSPEQCLNKPIDSRCDIYAMGVLMFQVLSGRLPFIGDTLVEVMTKHISAPAPKLASVLANSTFPDVLEVAVQQCLRKVPAQRQQSMAKLKEQLLPLVQPGERETLLQQISVIIADDNLVISEGIKHLLYKFEDVRVIATAATGREAAELVDQLRPDIVLMDFEMPEMDGLEAAQLIKASVPNTRIIMMSSHESEQDIINCFRAGAEGFMLKKFDSNTLPLAIRNVVQGATWLDPSISSNVLEIYRRSAPEIMQRAAARPLMQGRKEAPDDISFALKLAESFAAEEKYEEAQALFRLALAVLEKIKGTSNPEIMNATMCLADAYFSQNKLQQAEPLFFRSLELQVELLGPGHQSIAYTLEKIGEMYARQDNFLQAEQYFFGAYNIRDRAELPDHMAIAAICAKLAEVYTKQDKLGQADHYIQLGRRERAKTRRV